MSEAIENIGPHLLGRNQTTPDERDFPLEAWHEAATPLEMALAALQKSWTTSGTVKRWAKLATAAIEAGPVPAPTPTPTPDPTPTPPGPTPTPVPTPAPVNGVWPDPEVTLDQGQTGHCVGFGGAQSKNISPDDDDHQINADGDAEYYKCKVNDREPGQENGSTVHSLAQVMKAEGSINAYAWATNVQDVIKFVTTKGPVIIGIDWTDDMFNPDANNYIAPTGAIAGGHCLNVDGYFPDEDAFDLLNSWGPSWGQNGHVKIKTADMQKLLDGLDPAYPGEAMAAVQLA